MPNSSYCYVLPVFVAASGPILVGFTFLLSLSPATSAITWISPSYKEHTVNNNSPVSTRQGTAVTRVADGLTNNFLICVVIVYHYLA